MPYPALSPSRGKGTSRTLMKFFVVRTTFSQDKGSSIECSINFISQFFGHFLGDAIVADFFKGDLSVGELSRQLERLHDLIDAIARGDAAAADGFPIHRVGALGGIAINFEKTRNQRHCFLF